MAGPKRVSYSDVRPQDLPEFELPVGSGKFYPLRCYFGDMSLDEKIEYDRLVAVLGSDDEIPADATLDDRKAKLTQWGRQRGAVVLWLLPSILDNRSAEEALDIASSAPQSFFWNFILKEFNSDPFADARPAGGTTSSLSTGPSGSENPTAI